MRADTEEKVLAALARPEVACVLVPVPRAAGDRSDRSHVWLSRSSPRTRSSPATSRPSSGASRCSRSSCPSARSCPWAEPQVGAIATQAYANPRYGPNGLELLRQGLSAQEVVDRLTGEDDGRDQRQLGVVDGQGRAATYTGSECMDWAGGRTGDELRGAGQHPRLAGDRRRAGQDVRGDDRSARRAADRLPRGGAGGGWRQPRPAVLSTARRPARRGLREHVGHRRRAARRGPRASDRRAAPHLHAPRRDLRDDAARQMGRPWTTSWPRSCESDSRSSATKGTWKTRSRAGPGRKTSRTASTGSSKSTRSFSRH